MPASGPLAEAWPAKAGDQDTSASLPVLPGVVPNVSVVTRPSVLLAQFEDQIAQIRAALDAGGELARDLVEEEDSFIFPYKGRSARGSALHMAVQAKDGLPLVLKLIELRADVTKECRYRSLGKESTAQPVHLAVQSGDPDVLSALLEAGASINARSTRDGEDHFHPLHEAVFFRRDDIACFMLEQEANVNCSNLDGMTPLHVAAKNGAADAVCVLLKFRANIEMHDNLQRTALKVAVESGVFPHRRLHMLARWRVEDIMVVAAHSPCAVAGFMRDLCKDNSMPIQEVHKSSTVNRLTKSSTLRRNHWIDLMEEAPEGGSLLFDILTVEPDEDNPFYHPLPAQAVVQELQCTYNTDLTWTCETETGAPRWPLWHDRLAPGDDPSRRLRKRFAREARRRNSGDGRSSDGISKAVRGDLKQSYSGTIVIKDPEIPLRSISSVLGMSAVELNPVHIRQLRLPGVMSPEVFQVLAETKYLPIFEREATQSILHYAWHSFVRDYYTVQLCHRAVEIAVLVTWTFYDSTWSQDYVFSTWIRRCCWSFILVSSLRETVREMSQACGHMLRGDHWSYFGNYWNYLDWAVIVMFNTFSWSSVRTLNLNSDPRIFAAVSLFRWLQLLYTMRAYSMGKLGIRSIIPILHSLKEIGGMLIICLFTFVGFAHCFLVLDQDPENWQTIVVGTFRLLFLGDGDGIDTILTLGIYDSTTDITVAFGFLVVAVMVFCISLLNLFIAVHGEAYAQANQNSMALHMQERAALCLHCMMQPEWPPPPSIRRRLGVLGSRLRSPVLAYAVLSAVTLTVWGALLWIEALHPAATSVLALFAVLLGNCFLVQRPWQSEEEREASIMWWCCPVHEGSWQEEAQDDIPKKLEYLETRTDDITKHLVQLNEKLEQLVPSKSTARSTLRMTVSTGSCREAVPE